MRSAARGMFPLLLLISAPVWSQTPVPLTPKAVVRGQTSVPAGGTVILDARDSVSDANQPLQWHAVEPADLVLITADKGDRKDALAFFVTDNLKGRRYTVAVTAVAVDPLTRRVAVDTDLYSVETEPPAPPPVPVPVPPVDPTPTPTPTPTPLPVPVSPLGQLVQRYHTGFAAMLRGIGDQVAAGTIPDKKGAVGVVGAYGKPLAQALDAAFVGNIDATGKITNPTAIKAALYDAAAALGAY